MLLLCTVILLFLPAIGFLLFLKLSDSSLNLLFWSIFGRRTEAGHWGDQVIWLVGASSGIGESLALRLSSLPRVRLILSSRREELLQSLAKKCQDAGASCEILPMNICKMHTLSAISRKANKVYDRKVTRLVLCSGRSQRAEWRDVSPEVDLECFTVNTLGPVQLTRQLLKERAGPAEDLQVIVVSSVGALVPAILSASYGACKAALSCYFRLLPIEEKGVSVSIVHPSLVYAPNNPLTAFTSEAGKANGEVLEQPTSRHMSAGRAAELISLAATHRILDCTISQSPLVMAASIINAFSPGLISGLFKLIGMDRLRKIRGATKA